MSNSKLVTEKYSIHKNNYSKGRSGRKIEKSNHSSYGWFAIF